VSLPLSYFSQFSHNLQPTQMCGGCHGDAHTISGTCVGAQNTAAMYVCKIDYQAPTHPG
jgi:hypothetical protein